MQSVGFPKRSATAEAVEQEDPREPAAADQDARTHGLIYRGPGRRAWEERARPVLKARTDAIVRITTTTICGTDLQILKGDRRYESLRDRAGRRRRSARHAE